MTSYEARLTAAGFLGDLEVRLDGDTVRLKGTRASYPLMTARLAGQWLLAVAGIIGLIADVAGSGWVLLAAFVYSLVMYLWLWWDSTEQESVIAAGEHTEAVIGTVFRWYDAFWLLNLITAIAMLFTSASLGRRTVSFRGPGASTGRSARYLVVANDPAGAVALATWLLGDAALPESQRLG